MIKPVTVIIRGPHDSGRTTLASFIKMFLDENGYKDVIVQDTPPMSIDSKASFMDRFTRNRDLRSVKIVVELEASSGGDCANTECVARDDRLRACAAKVSDLQAKLVELGEGVRDR